MRPFLTTAVLATLAFPALAETVNEAIENSGQYWQRVSASSAIYIRGPKAQQLLNRDIARCVGELRELERLGVIKNAIPKYIDEGRIMSEAEAKLAGIDSPERDQELFAEHAEYHDFEGCMLTKGWERIKYVPYEVATQAREDYLDAHTKYRDRHKVVEYKGTDYDHLNQ